MKNELKIRRELADLLVGLKAPIILQWTSKIVQVHDYKEQINIVSAHKHKMAMAKFYNLLIDAVRRKDQVLLLGYMKSLIKDGHLGLNSPSSVIQGQILLRDIIIDFLCSTVKGLGKDFNSMVKIVTRNFDATIMHISKVFQKRRDDRLHTLVKLSKKLSTANDINKMLKLAVQAAAKESKADRASIMLIDKKGFLRVNASVGIPKHITQKVFVKEKIGKGIAGLVAKNNKPLIINKGDNTVKKFQKHMRGIDIVSALSLPITSNSSKVLGVLNLGKRSGKTFFDHNDIEILSVLTRVIAISLNNHQLFTEKEDMYAGTIFMLAAALDARDHYTHGHSQDVAKISVAIAKKMKLSKDQIDTIRRASLLHDIGKIGIPDSILNKPGTLTKKEFEIVKKHPQVGYNILKQMPQFKNLLPAVFYEHERYDGKGYITGLKEEEIPIEARIICVADAYNAMTSNRPYRKAMSSKKALAEIKRCSGTQFDPAVVDAFVKTFKKM